MHRQHLRLKIVVRKHLHWCHDYAGKFLPDLSHIIQDLHQLVPPLPLLLYTSPLQQIIHQHSHLPNLSSPIYHIPHFGIHHKKGVRGEVIGHNKSGNNFLCSGESLLSHKINLRKHGATKATLISYFCDNVAWHLVTPSGITNALRLVVRFLGPTIGFLSNDVSIIFVPPTWWPNLMGAFPATSFSSLDAGTPMPCLAISIFSQHLSCFFASLVVRRRYYNLHSNHEVSCF